MRNLPNLFDLKKQIVIPLVSDTDTHTHTQKWGEEKKEKN